MKLYLGLERLQSPILPHHPKAMEQQRQEEGMGHEDERGDGVDISVQVLSDLKMLLRHDEPRLRMKAGDLLPFLSEELSRETFEAVGAFLCHEMEEHLVRKEETRPTRLGSVHEIGLDDTTGWARLETSLHAYHRLLQAVLHVSQKESESDTMNRDSSADLAVHLLLRTVNNPQSCLAIEMVDLLADSFIKHQSRHIRELSYSQIAILLDSDHLPVLGEALRDHRPLASRFASLFIEALPYGLHDIFPQVRLAAGKAMHVLLYQTHSLLCVLLREEHEKDEGSGRDGIGLEEGDDRIDALLAMENPVDLDNLLPPRLDLPLPLEDGTSSLLQFLAVALHLNWPHILPRLSLNRFYPAESVQQVYETIFSSFLTLPHFLALHQHCLVKHSKVAVDYMVVSSRQGNHNVVEAACVALADLFLRQSTQDGDVTARASLRAQLPLACKALYQCLRDDRWPVIDTAIVACAQILSRYRDTLSSLPSPSQISSSLAASSFSQAIVDGFFDLLSHSMAIIREHAAKGLVLQLKLLAEDSVSVAAWNKLRLFLEGHLLAALGDMETTPNASKIKSFLPPAMLAPYMNKDKERRGIDGVPIPPQPPLDSKATRRKGWDCCIDCVEDRKTLNFELTLSAINVVTLICQLAKEEVYVRSIDISSLLRSDLTLTLSSPEVYIKHQAMFGGQRKGDGRYAFQMDILSALTLLLQERQYREYVKVMEGITKMVSILSLSSCRVFDQLVSASDVRDGGVPLDWWV